MATNYQHITLALAGVCQSAKLVQQFAHQGQADHFAFQVSLNSLLHTQPENILAVYGGELQNIKLGLQTLLAQLDAKDAELTNYWLNILMLSQKFNQNSSAKTELANRIQYLPTQLEHYDLFDEIMLEKLAMLYSDIISPLSKPLRITGSPLYLQQTNIQHRVRACLLAGVRSGILWQQMGGTKWQILFSRRKIFNVAQQILNSI